MTLRESDYWEKHYEVELRNFEQNGDEGDIWFGKSLTRKIAQWINEHMRGNDSAGMSLGLIDIGCGNAYMLISVASSVEKCSLHLMGLDYSLNSITLSRQMVRSRNLEGLITLESCDFLQTPSVRSVTKDRKFDYVIDKGTYDAICLIASNTEDGLRDARARYVQSLNALIKQGTIFVIAVCNHIESEILDLLSGGNNRDSIGVGVNFRVIDRIETPKIQFGGKQGSQVSCIIIQFD